VFGASDEDTPPSIRVHPGVQHLRRRIDADAIRRTDRTDRCQVVPRATPDLDRVVGRLGGVSVVA
jgi:hypothetical protein